MAKLSFQIEKQAFVNFIKNSYKNAVKNNDMNLLSGLHIVKTKDKKELKFVTTDGNRLYVLTINNLDILKEKGQLKPVTIDLEKLSKISFFKFKKGVFHLLQVTIDDASGMTIFDPLADITYKISLLRGQYPKWEQLFDKEFYKSKKRQSVYVNCDILCQVLQSTARNFRNQIVELNIDKNNNLEKIYIYGKDPDDRFSTTTILMPIQLRDGEFHDGSY